MDGVDLSRRPRFKTAYNVVNQIIWRVLFQNQDVAQLGRICKKPEIKLGRHLLERLDSLFARHEILLPSVYLNSHIPPKFQPVC